MSWKPFKFRQVVGIDRVLRVVEGGSKRSNTRYMVECQVDLGDGKICGNKREMHHEYLTKRKREGAFYCRKCRKAVMARQPETVARSAAESDWPAPPSMANGYWLWGGR